MDQKHRGCRSEMMACVWLLDHGFEVFRNVSPHGDTDLIAIKNGELLRLDVKTVMTGREISPWRRLSNEAVAAGVMILNVFDDGRCEIVKPTPRSDPICPVCSTSFKQRANKKFCSGRCVTINWKQNKRAAHESQIIGPPDQSTV